MKFFINFNLHLLSGTLSSNQSIHTLDLVLHVFMSSSVSFSIIKTIFRQHPSLEIIFDA